MTNIIQANAIESALIQGDLSKLTTEQRLSYYKNVCESVGLNYLTKPFDYIQLNGKLTLYAKRDATDQLRKVHGVSIKITAREKIDDIYIVTAQGTDKTGRIDESTGAVNVAGLKGESLANAFLKCETKAKRRVTLSLCGLGLLDETEVQTIPDAKPFDEQSIAQQNVAAFKEIAKEEGFTKPSEIIDVEQVASGDFEINFGKMKGRKLNSFNYVELTEYKDRIDSSLKQGIDGKPITGKLRENMIWFLDSAEKYLKEIKPQKVEPKFDTEEKIPN